LGTKRKQQQQQEGAKVSHVWSMTFPFSISSKVRSFAFPHPLVSLSPLIIVLQAIAINSGEGKNEEREKG
jgi:hypothetical protein